MNTNPEENSPSCTVSLRKWKPKTKSDLNPYHYFVPQDGWRHERERESKPSDLVMFAGDGTKGEATPATHSVRFAASGAFYLLLRATTAAPELASLPARRLARRLGAAAGHRRRRRRRGRHGFDGDPDFPEAHISWARTRSRSRAAQEQDYTSRAALKKVYINSLHLRVSCGPTNGIETLREAHCCWAG